MSSRLMPPKAGAISLTLLTISSGSVESRQMGNASTPPNSLNRQHLPSITGSAASGPIDPRPSTARATARRARDAAQAVLPAPLDRLARPDDPACLADRARELPQRAMGIVDLHANRKSVLCARRGAHRSGSSFVGGRAC